MVTVSSGVAWWVTVWDGEGFAGRSAWAQDEHWQRTLAARRTDKQNTCFTAGASSRNFETCGNHNFGNNFTPWTLARAKERNPEICHTFWLPSTLFCDVPPAHNVGVRKDTLPARSSGEYLFTRSKPGRPKRGLHPQWCRQRGLCQHSGTPTRTPRGNHMVAQSLVVAAGMSIFSESQA